jgi:CheY-like chemotaxis protein
VVAGHPVPTWHYCATAPRSHAITPETKNGEASVSFVIWHTGADTLPSATACPMGRSCFNAAWRAARTPSSPVASKGKILLIEPDDLIRRLVEQWLAEAGYTVTTPRAMPERRDCGVVLTLADLPGTGPAHKAIKALQVPQGTPILLVSTRFRRGLASSAEAATRLGVQKVLSKPFTREELLAAIADTLRM